MTRHTTESFIELAKVVHKKYYDYTALIFKDTKTKVLIRCPTHGIFYQMPTCHLRGSGCIKCGHIKISNTKMHNLEDIIKRSITTHGMRYDYSLVKYTGMNQKVDIICNIHGIFKQRPSDHIRLNGCPECSNRQRALSIDTFLQRVKHIHKGEYTYPNLSFTRNADKINVLCPNHGIFSPTVGNHIYEKSGCPKCANIRIGKAHTIPIEQKIKKALAVHKGKYVYISEESTNKRVVILCSIHGKFSQTWSNHVSNSQGCKKCYTGGRYSYKFFQDPKNQNLRGVLYVLKFTSNTEEFYKVGITKNINKRINQLSCKKEYNIKIITQINGNLASLFELEQKILNEHCYRNRYTPLYKIGGDCECFTPKIINVVLDILETVQINST